MEQEKKLTARSRDGQEFQFNYDEKKYISFIQSAWHLQTDYDELTKKGLSVPVSMKGKAIQVKIVEQEKVQQFKDEEKRKKEQKKENELEIAMNAPIVGLVYEIGCDCADTKYFNYAFAEKISFDAEYQRQQKDEKLLKKVCEYVSKSEDIKMNLPSTLGSYGGYEIGEEIQEIIKKVEEEIKIEKAENEKQEKEKEAEIEKLQIVALEKAKKSGKDIFVRILNGYDGDEAYPGKELGWVNIVEIATPEGKLIQKESACH